MAISRFRPQASSSASSATFSEYFFSIAPNNTHYINISTVLNNHSGIFRIRLFDPAGTSTLTTPTVRFLNSSLSQVGSDVVFRDADTGSTVNYSEAYVSRPANTSFISLLHTATFYATIDLLPLSSASTGSVSVFSNSQNVTISQASPAVLIGGGGGGGKGRGSGGGGSGFRTSFTINPGTYALVVGAGGAPGCCGSTGNENPGERGGTSTFSNFSAEGGYGGINGSGGQGGGGGGWGGSVGGTGGTSSAPTGGTGGVNGDGSGESLPGWTLNYSTTASTNANRANAGQGGRFYGGGGGGQFTNSSGNGGQSGQGIGGGGGGDGGWYSGAGAGASGGLAILNFSG